MKTENPGKLVAYFVRHGETDGNAKGLFRGALDFPLSTKANMMRLVSRITSAILILVLLIVLIPARAGTTAETVLEPKALRRPRHRI